MNVDPFLGYKLRTHIAKSLQTRCKTIRRAVEAYNTAAAALQPPKASLDWTQVSNYAFVEHFTLLQDTQEDIRNRPWSQPLGREVLKLRRHLERAKEEVLRCNVETRRLATSIRDEDIHFSNVLSKLQRAHDPIYGAVADFTTRRQRINQQIHKHIDRIYALPEFTGTPSPGTCINPGMDTNVADSRLHDEQPASQNMDSRMSAQDANSPETAPLEIEGNNTTLIQPPTRSHLDTLDDEHNSDEDDAGLEDEDLVHDIGGLAQFFDGLGVRDGE